MSAERRPVGRPPKYTPEFAEEVRETAIELFNRGLGIAPLARQLGVARQTIYDWASKDPELSDTLSLCRDHKLGWWEEKMTDAALNGTGNSAMFKFLVTNQHRDDYQETQNLNVKSEGVIEMELIDYTGYDAEDED